MRIAIVKLSAMGDIIHSMVVIQFIKKYNKEISIDWFVEESYKDLLESHPDINKVHSVNIKLAKKNKSLFILFKEYKKITKCASYDLVIDMQGLIKSAIISKLIPSKLLIGFDRHSAREGLASFFYSKTFKIDYKENVLKRNFELIKFALNLPYNFSNLGKKLPFLFTRDNFNFNYLSKNKNNVLLIPGASHPSKRYSTDKFIKLTEILDANFLIIWGDEGEKLLAKKIKKFAPNVNIINKISLDRLISLVYQIDLVIGPDTGPTHIGWALNIPSITLFGPTPGNRNTLITSINKVIESESFVNPYKISKNDFSINSIDASEIAELAMKLLD